MLVHSDTDSLMPADGAEQSIDIRFSVPFTHRLRTTEDVAGDDFADLLHLLEGGEDGPARVLVWADEEVFESSDRVRRIADKLSAADSVKLVASATTVAGGESVKNSPDAIDRMLRQINVSNLDRRSYIIAIGGGAMLDAAGYAAAIAHRGIRLVRLPTTTLAQADSGVGVKNAVNYFGKKNWIGTFAVPWAVVNDAALLETLPDRDFHSGFSEAVKVSLLKDRGQFDWLGEHAEAIHRREPGVVKRAIHQSCLLHLQHITEGGDPFEMLEARPLDFGHWSAHKLEPLTQYRLRHGEAVGIGVAIDCLYSSLAYGFPREDAMLVCETLSRLGLPLWDRELEPVDRLLEGLEEFRQHLGGRLTVTMLEAIGQPIDVHAIDAVTMRAAIAQLKTIAKELPSPSASENASSENIVTRR